MECKSINIYGQGSKISQYDLEEIFFIQYNDLFSKLLSTNIVDFFSLLKKQVLFHLKIIDKECDISLLSFFYEKYYDICQNDKFKIQNIYDKIINYPEYNIISLNILDVYIHCYKCKDAIHKCGKQLLIFDDLYFCLNCNKVYNQNHIKLFCKECNKTYLTTKRSLLEKNYEYFYSVSFMNYHCYIENEEKIKCLSCGDDLYYNITKEKPEEQNKIRDIYCIKCKLIFDTKKIYFKCKVCGDNFKCEPQIFRNFSSIKKYLLLLVHTFRKGIYAIPNELINKKCNCDLNGVLYFFHHDNGILYQGKKNGKDVIICDCCYGIFKPDNFNWNCPFCQKNFKTIKTFDAPNKTRRIIRKQIKQYIPSTNINLYNDNINQKDNNRYNNGFYKVNDFPTDNINRNNNKRKLIQSASYVHNRELSLNNDKNKKRFLYLIDNKNANINNLNDTNKLLFKIGDNISSNNELLNNYSYDKKIIKNENIQKTNLKYQNIKLKKKYLNKENINDENINYNKPKNAISYLDKSYNNIRKSNIIIPTNNNKNSISSSKNNIKKNIEIPSKKKIFMKGSKSVNNLQKPLKINISEPQTNLKWKPITKIDEKNIKNIANQNYKNNNNKNNINISINNNVIQMNYSSNLNSHRNKSSTDIKNNKNEPQKTNNKEKNKNINENNKNYTNIYQKKIMYDQNVLELNKPINEVISNSNDNIINNKLLKNNLIKIENKNKKNQKENICGNVNNNIKIYKNKNKNKIIKIENKTNINSNNKRKDIKDNIIIQNSKKSSTNTKTKIISKEPCTPNNINNKEMNIIFKNKNINTNKLSRKINQNGNSLEKTEIVNNRIILNNKRSGINNNSIHISINSIDKTLENKNSKSPNKDNIRNRNSIIKNLEPNDKINKTNEQLPLDNTMNKFGKKSIKNNNKIHKKNISLNLIKSNNIKKNDLNDKKDENLDNDNKNNKDSIAIDKNALNNNVEKVYIMSDDKNNKNNKNEYKEGIITINNSKDNINNSIYNKKLTDNINNNVNDKNMNEYYDNILVINQNNALNHYVDNSKKIINKSTKNILLNNKNIIFNNRKVDNKKNKNNKNIKKNLSNSINFENKVNNNINVIFNNKITASPSKNILSKSINCNFFNNIAMNLNNNLNNDDKNNLGKDSNDNIGKSINDNLEENNILNNNDNNNLDNDNLNNNLVFNGKRKLINKVDENVQKNNINIINNNNNKIKVFNSLSNNNIILNNQINNSTNNNKIDNINKNINNIINNKNNNNMNKEPNKINNNQKPMNINNTNYLKNNNIGINDKIINDNNNHPKDSIRLNKNNNNNINKSVNIQIINNNLNNQNLNNNNSNHENQIDIKKENNIVIQNNIIQNNNLKIKPATKKDIKIDDNNVIKLKIYFSQMENVKNELKRKLSFDCRNSINHFQLFNNQEQLELKTFDSNYYKIIRQIGKGTYGEIYLVQDPKTLGLYALKKIIISDSLELKDNEEEYKLTWKLTHGNPDLKIAKKYAIEIKKLDKYNLVMYILMEAANCDWEQELLNRQKVSAFYKENEIIGILKSLVNTFAILQKKGISHRDVKPQNILCFGNEGYKLTDFGEAKTKNQQIAIKNLYGFEQNTNKQTIRGTELYMSPILFRALQSKIIDNVQYNAYKSDVFSLGMCFLLASSLNYQSLFEIREVLDMKIIERVVNKYLGKLYSKNYINLIISMLQVDEKLRPDFIELNSAFI